MAKPIPERSSKRLPSAMILDLGYRSSPSRNQDLRPGYRRLGRRRNRRNRSSRRDNRKCSRLPCQVRLIREPCLRKPPPGKTKGVFREIHSLSRNSPKRLRMKHIPRPKMMRTLLRRYFDQGRLEIRQTRMATKTCRSLRGHVVGRNAAGWSYPRHDGIWRRCMVRRLQSCALSAHRWHHQMRTRLSGSSHIASSGCTLNAV